MHLAAIRKAIGELLNDVERHAPEGVRVFPLICITCVRSADIRRRLPDNPACDDSRAHHK